MTTTRVENLPATWDDARDLPFFRITARIFTSEFCLGASVLLASYDDTVELTPASTTTTPATVNTHTQPERATSPARVRRTR